MLQQLMSMVDYSLGAETLEVSWEKTSQDSSERILSLFLQRRFTI